MNRPIAIHSDDAARVAWRSKRNDALNSGAALPGWEAHVHTFTPRDPRFPTMGGAISGQAILVGADRGAVERAASEYPATFRQLFEHGNDLMYRGEVA